MIGSNFKNFKGGSVSLWLRCVGFGGAIPRRVRPRGYRFQRPPAERSEAPLSEARLHRAKRGRAAKVIGRSPLQKNSKRFHQKAQGNHLFFSATFFFFFFFFRNSTKLIRRYGLWLKVFFFKKNWLMFKKASLTAA